MHIIIHLLYDEVKSILKGKKYFKMKFEGFLGITKIK